MSNKCKLFSIKFNYLQIYVRLSRCGVAGAFIHQPPNTQDFDAKRYTYLRINLSFSQYCTRSCLIMIPDMGVAHKLLKKKTGIR